MRKVKLNNGKTYNVDRCGASGDLLMINVISGTIKALASVFSDPEKTSRIEHYFEGTETDHVFYEGYTVLTGITLSDTGTTVMLRRDTTWT